MRSSARATANVPSAIQHANDTKFDTQCELVAVGEKGRKGEEREPRGP